MLAVDIRLDELRLVDDPVDGAVIVSEFEEGFERATLAVQAIRRFAKRGAHIVGDLGRHVADERLEQFLLRIEVSVESTERHAGALGDADDRAVGKAALAEFLARGIEDLAQCALAARSARRLAYCRADRRLYLHFCPHAAPLPRRTIFAS